MYVFDNAYVYFSFFVLWCSLKAYKISLILLIDLYIRKTNRLLLLLLLCYYCIAVVDLLLFLSFSSFYFSFQCLSLSLSLSLSPLKLWCMYVSITLLLN